ncbi:MAG: hypothetical protein HY519_03475 [Candidatus Aenigmarchaeota archaeon]|nr:hypothetical protein [Candidatus Aenigmarchaeota archaeon]
MSGRRINGKQLLEAAAAAKGRLEEFGQGEVSRQHDGGAQQAPAAAEKVNAAPKEEQHQRRKLGEILGPLLGQGGGHD